MKNYYPDCVKRRKMSLLTKLMANNILMAGIISWLTAQALKTLVDAFVNKEINWQRLAGDGGMPSGHSATVTAVAATAGLQCGFETPEFAIAAILAVIVMHDAMGVRREAGKQAKVINEMMNLFLDLGQPQLSMEKKLKELVGHTPLQVAAGCILGLLVSFIYYYR